MGTQHPPEAQGQGELAWRNGQFVRKCPKEAKNERPRSRQSASDRFDALALDSSEDYEYEEWGISMQQEHKEIRESGTPPPHDHYTDEEVANYAKAWEKVKYQQTPKFSAPTEKPPPHFEALSEQEKAQIAKKYLADNFEKSHLNRIAEAPGATKVMEEISQPTTARAIVRRAKSPNSAR